MIRSSSAENSLPFPSGSTLLYRATYSDPWKEKRSGDEFRPRPAAADTAIARRFTAINGVKKDYCWVTGSGYPPRVHILPHAEADCPRLILWLELMGITPTTLGERCKWKNTSANLVPLQHGISQHLNEKFGRAGRAAIVRPTRKDLLQLVQVLEDALWKECQNTQPGWQPRWDDIIEASWPRQQTIGAIRRPEYLYQIDFFDLSPDCIFIAKDRNATKILTQEQGITTYSNTLQHDLDKFKAPLSILTVIAVAVSRLWSMSQTSDRRYKPDFLQDLDIMSYVINILGSAAPESFRTMNRPSVLPPLAPLDRSSQTSRRLRQWPDVDAARPIDPTSSLPLFSSSPPKGYRGNLAVLLYKMESEEMQASEEEEPAARGGRRDDAKDSEGSAGASSMEQRRARHPSSMGTSSCHSGSTATDSQTTEVELNAATSTLQLDGKAAADAALHSDSNEREEEEENESDSAEEYETWPIDLPLEESWQQEWQSLDDEQDLILQAAASALVQRLQAPPRTSSNTRNDYAVAEATLFDFLVSNDPLPGITPRLQAIEQRRERMLEQWEELVHRRETQDFLERHPMR